jgi:hypothetical protein
MSIEQLRDLKFFAPTYFKVKDKKGHIVPFVLNRAQLYADQRLDEQLKKQGFVRAMVLKGRQQGMSTYISARFTHKIITNRGKTAYILTHEAQATANLFGMSKRYIDNLPPGLCPEPDSSSANKLNFKCFESGYIVGTAGNSGAGRSNTIQYFHGSEVALWPHADDHADGVMQAVPRAAGTEMILESTAKGMGNYFHKMWMNAMSGESDYIAIFVPWYWQDEYTADTKGFVLTLEEEEILRQHESNGLTIPHLMWRRLKIAENVGENGADLEERTEKFQQEYPMTAAEAFRNSVKDTFIKSKYVMRARKSEVDTDAGLIIGVDPALGEKDKFTIIRRRGRYAYKLERHTNHNTMQIVGLVRKIIEREQPVKVFIDVIGIGAGIVDRLQELGFDIVEGINSARDASEKKKYVNKRAEMWAEMRDWLNQESEVQVPDSDVLESDLTCLGYRYDSNGRLQIESKEALKKRGMPSPDCADALALTFAGGFFDISHGEANYKSSKASTIGKFY